MQADGELLVPSRFYLADQRTSSWFTGRGRSTRRAGSEIASKPGINRSHKSPGTFLVSSDTARRQQMIFTTQTGRRPHGGARPGLGKPDLTSRS
jgi:hypothetical protein